jgi:hypothetical protein
MPLDSPGGLDNQTYIDIVAYLLQAASFRRCRRARHRDGQKRPDRRPGQPRAAPDAAPVRVVGASLNRPTRRGFWHGPASRSRRRTPEPSTGGTPDGPEQTALGTATLGLVNLNPAPDPYKGHKIEARDS